ncbi:hypothetical protein [Cyanobium sp. CH-040]|uniref:hypothetical protein n=1 Tax=Cyanobium sp. CH-040 TaxID=2823708 RepID=UPI0020CEC9DC|nr:hypothetical protein [Cyanobium sp. CH-040]MCP9927902.1 hypothetical protein [Cyanobium sp. CH-040]
MLYARDFRRILLIDGSRAGQLRKLDRYFETNSQSFPVIIIGADSDIYDNLDGLSVYPGAVAGNLRGHASVYDTQRKLHIDPESRVPICFDYVSYPHDILVHAQCGGGAGWAALQLFRLTHFARTIVSDRLRMLPSRYRAIHIRNTDKRMDVLAFLDEIAPKVAGMPLLVSTDNAASVDLCRSRLVGCDVFTVSQVPDSHGNSLHDNPDYAGLGLDIDILADLIAMSKACELILPAKGGEPLSGFSAIAADLHVRPSVLGHMLRS